MESARRERKNWSEWRHFRHVDPPGGSSYEEASDIASSSSSNKTLSCMASLLLKFCFQSKFILLYEENFCSLLCIYRFNILKVKILTMMVVVMILVAVVVAEVLVAVVVVGA